MTGREVVPTHSAYLELQAERAGMQEGYRFLDEKRLILASEILAGLKLLEETLTRWREARALALEALRGAIGRHGLEELSVYPAAAGVGCAGEAASRPVLGVRIDAVPELAPWPAEDRRQGTPGPTVEPVASAVFPSPEAELCRERFVNLLPIAARLAAVTGNLERLRQEYVRTSRRARALEDVLLPEIDESLRSIDAALEELDREEVVRVRRAGLDGG